MFQLIILGNYNKHEELYMFVQNLTTYDIETIAKSNPKYNPIYQEINE